MAAPAWTREEFMAAALAREVRDGEQSAVGTISPIPASAVLLAHYTHAPRPLQGVLRFRPEGAPRSLLPLGRPDRPARQSQYYRHRQRRPAAAQAARRRRLGHALLSAPPRDRLPRGPFPADLQGAGGRGECSRLDAAQRRAPGRALEGHYPALRLQV